MTTKVSGIAYHSDDLGTTAVTRSTGSAMEDGGVCYRALSASSGTFPFFFSFSRFSSLFSFLFFFLANSHDSLSWWSAQGDDYGRVGPQVSNAEEKRNGLFWALNQNLN